MKFWHTWAKSSPQKLEWNLDLSNVLYGDAQGQKARKKETKNQYIKEKM